MEWLIVVGLCFDIAGAILVVGAILLMPRAERRTWGVPYPASEPSAIAVRELTYTWTGAGFLVVGFVFQLAAYLWGLAPSNVVLVAVVALPLYLVLLGVIVAELLAGRRVSRLWTPAAMRRWMDGRQRAATR